MKITHLQLEPQLTSRELEIAERIRIGATNKQIAIELGISSYTVRDHISRMLKKLGVGRRAGLASALAENRGSALTSP